MACRATSIKRKRCSGLTLVDLLVTVGVGTLVLLAAGSLLLYGARSFAAQFHYVDMENASHLALDRMSQQIRQANFLTNYSPTQLTFVDSDGVLLAFTYSPQTRTLTRSKSGRSEVLLRECDSVQFSLFQRIPAGGTYTFTATTNPAACKLVRIEWDCSRTVFGQKATTDAITGAQIVIRNKH